MESRIRAAAHERSSLTVKAVVPDAYFPRSGHPGSAEVVFEDGGAVYIDKDDIGVGHVIQSNFDMLARFTLRAALPESTEGRPVRSIRFPLMSHDGSASVT